MTAPTPPSSLQSNPTIIDRAITANDIPAVEALHAKVFGPGRFVRTAYRVREGTPVTSPYCRGAYSNNNLVAALRMTLVAIGTTKPHLLLGPLAVDPAFAGLGHGRNLVSEALAHAKLDRIGLVVLVGDLPYYERFGFKPAQPGQIVFPGPVNPARILLCELTPDTASRAHGTLTPL